MTDQERLLDFSVINTDEEYNNLANQSGFCFSDLAEIRNYIEDLWLTFKPLADTKFKSQIKSNFHSCFFEMYLANCLVKQGKYKLQSEDFGPDFYIEELNAWVECIIATNGKVGNPDSVPPYEYLDPKSPSTHKTEQVPNDKVILRYTAAFAEKEEKYKGYLDNGVVSKDQPLVIAINAAKVNFSRLEPGFPRILSALFPIGDQYVNIDRESLETKGSGINYSAKILKENRKEVSKLTFLSEEFSYISGVIFSIHDVWNLDSLSKLGADLVYVPNPYAKNPLSIEFLNVGRFCKVSIDENNLEIELCVAS